MNSAAPTFSINICTYNRAESLKETLESLVGQTLSACESYEVLVIDNNSTDSTKTVVEDFIRSGRLPLRYLFEPNQGVAYARNRGLCESRGDIIAYLDDDVVVSPGWLDGMSRCFAEEDADMVGGRIARKWNCEKPDWFSEEIGGCLISQEFGGRRIRWTNPRKHLVTANIAIRLRVFEAYGKFRDDLGRRGDSLLGGEDRELYRRLIESGAKVFYEPTAMAFHKVEKERLTQAYFRRWFFEIGKTLGHEMPWKSTIAPLWTWGNYLRACLRYLKNRLRNVGPAESFAAELWVLYYIGMISECFAHWIPFIRNACAFNPTSKEKQQHEYAVN